MSSIAPLVAVFTMNVPRVPVTKAVVSVVLPPVRRSLPIISRRIDCACFLLGCRVVFFFRFARLSSTSRKGRYSSSSCRSEK